MQTDIPPLSLTLQWHVTGTTLLLICEPRVTMKILCGGILRCVDKLVPVHPLKPYGESVSIAPPILNLGMKWMWSASRPGCFSPSVSVPGTHWAGCKVIPTVGHGVLAKRFLSILPGTEPILLALQPFASSPPWKSQLTLSCESLIPYLHCYLCLGLSYTFLQNFQLNVVSVFLTYHACYISRPFRRI
jgi:hypothetical protein